MFHLRYVIATLNTVFALKNNLSHVWLVATIELEEVFLFYGSNVYYRNQGL